MSLYVIMFARGRMLGWNRSPVPPEGTNKGWRPYVWTPNLADAEKFTTREAALEFGARVIPHDRWHTVLMAGEERLA